MSSSHIPRDRHEPDTERHPTDAPDTDNSVPFLVAFGTYFIVAVIILTLIFLMTR